MLQGRKGARTGLTGPPAAPAGEARRRSLLVLKRDGRCLSFQRQKIAEAVLRAMEEAGEPDPAFAAEVAGIVELSLLERAAAGAAGEPQALSIEIVQDLVERALMELGRPAVAKAYILHRDLRARMRSALRVHRSETLRSPVRVREREGVSSWSKGRIVAALMQEAELSREAAEDVAGAVERRVFASGLRRLTTGLVRELVAGELFERGWIRALSAARVVGLARHDVRRVLEGSPLHPWSAPAPLARREARGLAGELLARYALESVLPEGPGELHRAGDLHVVGLEELVRPLSVALDAELLASGGEPARSAHGVLDGLSELVRSVAGTVVLEHPGSVLAPLARATREGSPHGLTAWLHATGALARATGTRIELGSPGPRFAAFTARLLEELGELPAEGTPVLYLEGGELEALLVEREGLRPLVERLLAGGRLVPCWSGAEEAFAGPGCVRRADEPGVIACGAAVALNLPRLARRAGPYREELFQTGLAELVQAALEAARALRAAAPHSLRQPLGLHARGSCALVPVGLREALLVLGDGTLDPEQGLRLLGVLGDAARRFSRDDLLEWVPCPFFGAEAARRFAYLDARVAEDDGTRQAWLFAGAEGEPPELRPYGQGFRVTGALSLSAGRDEAAILRTVPAGALSFAGLDGRGSEAEYPHLDAWRRFELLRRSHAGELVLELFPRARPRSPSTRGAGSHERPPLRPV
jgi:hypothetical protein